MFKYSVVFILIIFFPLICKGSESFPIQSLQLPANFHIDVFAKIPEARSMSLGENTVFVSTRSAGKIYKIVLNQNKTAAEKIYLLAEKLDSPNGIAFYQNNLFVAEPDRIIRFDNVESRLPDRKKPKVILDNLPNLKGHDWRYIKIGPDGKLYISIGAPCNVCLSNNPQFATIMRMSLDGSHNEIVANGVRNSMGFDWHPITKELWFTDNGRDNLGDNIPPDELNRVTENGRHYGFPYLYGNNIPDPNYIGKIPALNFVAPMRELGPHVAALGMIFYTGKMFPKTFQNQILIAEHGSWNRSSKIGYRVTKVDLQKNSAISYQTFIDGWLQDQTARGRPVDILQMPDGAILISDDYAGIIYRVTYKDE